MNTKKNPGPFDDYAAAEPDEPMFVLLGRDPQAADLVRLWAMGRDFLEGADDPKVAAAFKCAKAMKSWCVKRAGEGPVDALTLLPFQMLADELRRRGATVVACAEGMEDMDDLDDRSELDS